MLLVETTTPRQLTGKKMTETRQELHDKFEPHPDAEALTGTEGKKIDYEPHPEKSIEISAEHEEIVRAITALYSGSASEKDLAVYAETAVYDDPLSFCDTRTKIGGQCKSSRVVTSRVLEFLRNNVNL